MNSKLILVVQLFLFPLVAKSTDLSFIPPAVPELFIGDSKNVSVILSNVTIIEPNCSLHFVAEPEPAKVLGAVLDCSSMTCEDYGSAKQCNLSLNLEGRSLGLAKVFIAEIINISAEKPTPARIPDPYLDVAVLRPPKIIHKVFNGLVATIVSLNYINMGCALDLKVVKSVIKRPIGPIVGMVCQFVIMPVVAYGVGLWIFTDPVQRLGLFTFGSSPSGGASNMWTVLLGGNLNLSITMTFFSAVIAIGTIPLWLFTLGKTIVRGTKINIPFTSIALSLVAIAVPVAVGLLIQRYLPKVAAVCRRILAPVSVIMIVLIVILGSIAYWELLLLLTWPVVFAASLNVWLGFLSGCLASLAFRFPRKDVIAVTVETGIQNTGISYLLLIHSLKPPANEIASVIPVAASIITPLPLFIIFSFQKIKDRCCASKDYQLEPLTKSQKGSNDDVKGVDNYCAVESAFSNGK